MFNREYISELALIVSSIEEEKRNEFITQYNARAHNPTVIFGLSIFLGYIGVDRFFLGQTLLGILKLITLGGLQIWYLVDLFLVASAARKRNIEIATALANDLKN